MVDSRSWYLLLFPSQIFRTRIYSPARPQSTDPVFSAKVKTEQTPLPWISSACLWPVNRDCLLPCLLIRVSYLCLSDFEIPALLCCFQQYFVSPTSCTCHPKACILRNIFMQAIWTPLPCSVFTIMANPVLLSFINPRLQHIRACTSLRDFHALAQDCSAIWSRTTTIPVHPTIFSRFSAPCCRMSGAYLICEGLAPFSMHHMRTGFVSPLLLQT